MDRIDFLPTLIIDKRKISLSYYAEDKEILLLSKVAFSYFAYLRITFRMATPFGNSIRIVYIPLLKLERSII